MYYAICMTTILDMCDALGRKEMGQRLGVKRAAIANAVSEGKFPPRWYVVLSRMCAEKDVPCPVELFNFAEEKSPDQEDAA
jgi:hypothetical protein